MWHLFREFWGEKNQLNNPNPVVMNLGPRILHRTLYRTLFKSGLRAPRWVSVQAWPDPPLESSAQEFCCTVYQWSGNHMLYFIVKLKQPSFPPVRVVGIISYFAFNLEKWVESVSFSFIWQLEMCQKIQSGIYVQLSLAISHHIYCQINVVFSRISVKLQLQLGNE